MRRHSPPASSPRPARMPARLSRRRSARSPGRSTAGPRARGAAARVLPMLDAVAEMGDAEKWVSEALARKERIMGFGHRIYRAEDPRSRLLKRTAKELASPRVEIAEALEQAAHEAIAKKTPDHSYTNVEFWSAI